MTNCGKVVNVGGGVDFECHFLKAVLSNANIQQYSDLLFQGEMGSGHFYRVHRAVLSAVSPVIASLFRGTCELGDPPDPQYMIMLPGFSQVAVQRMLDFIYNCSGVCDVINESDLSDLVCLLEALGIQPTPERGWEITAAVIRERNSNSNASQEINSNAKTVLERNSNSNSPQDKNFNAKNICERNSNSNAPQVGNSNAETIYERNFAASDGQRTIKLSGGHGPSAASSASASCEIFSGRSSGQSLPSYSLNTGPLSPSATISLCSVVGERQATLASVKQEAGVSVYVSPSISERNPVIIAVKDEFDRHKMSSAIFSATAAATADAANDSTSTGCDKNSVVISSRSPSDRKTTSNIRLTKAQCRDATGHTLERSPLLIAVKEEVVDIQTSPKDTTVRSSKAQCSDATGHTLERNPQLIALIEEVDRHKRNSRMRGVAARDHSDSDQLQTNYDDHEHSMDRNGNSDCDELLMEFKCEEVDPLELEEGCEAAVDNLVTTVVPPSKRVRVGECTVCGSRDKRSLLTMRKVKLSAARQQYRQLLASSDSDSEVESNRSTSIGSRDDWLTVDSTDSAERAANNGCQEQTVAVPAERKYSTKLRKLIANVMTNESSSSCIDKLEPFTEWSKETSWELQLRIVKVFQNYDFSGQLCCPHCNKSRSEPSGIAMHVILKHSFVKSFKKATIARVTEFLHCVYCEGRRANLGSLIRHLMTVHMNVKAYQCQFCSKTFTSKYYRKKHEKIFHHGAPKTFSCCYCTYSFHDKSNCTKHEQRCPRQRSRLRPKSYRKKHEKIIHRGAPKTFSCCYCSHSFHDKSNCTKHEQQCPRRRIDLRPKSRRVALEKDIFWS